MKKADSLIENVAKGVAAREGKAVETSGQGAPAPRDLRDHIDVINQLFAEFELAYHNQYHKAYAQEGSVALAKKYWLECLGHFSPEVILAATRQVVTSQEYLPSVATIVHACEESMSRFGLPSAHDAYVEACCATHPKAEYAWSHPAVYHAGKETGWFELANRTEAQMFPLFENHYRKLCQRVLHGEELAVEKQEALPEQSSKQLSLEENKAKMAELRKSLKK